MKFLLLSLLFISTLSAFGANKCPDLTGEYAKCHNPMFGTVLESIDLITVYEANGKFSINSDMDGESISGTEGDNIMPDLGANYKVTCKKESIKVETYISTDSSGNYNREVGAVELSLDKDGNLIYGLIVDNNTPNEQIVPVVCKRK